jgi:hypothetical protein
MQIVRYRSPALAIFQTIAESRFVLQARLPSVVGVVFLSNITVLAQLYISPPDDGTWGIVHAVHSYGIVQNQDQDQEQD